MNTRIFAPGVVQVFKSPLRERVRNALAVTAFLATACVLGAASAWLIARVL